MICTNWMDLEEQLVIQSCCLLYIAVSKLASTVLNTLFLSLDPFQFV